MLSINNIFNENIFCVTMKRNMEKYLDPANDYAFKKIFSNEFCLKDFINRILQLRGKNKIEQIFRVTQEELPPIVGGRKSIFDIKVKDGTGKYYIIEMQKYSDSAFVKRVEFYAAHCFVEQLRRGMLHSELLPVVVISITKNNLFPDDVPCVSVHRTKEDATNNVHLRSFNFVFAELGKLEKRKRSSCERLASLVCLCKG